MTFLHAWLIVGVYSAATLCNALVHNSAWVEWCDLLTLMWGAVGACMRAGGTNAQSVIKNLTPFVLSFLLSLARPPPSTSLQHPLVTAFSTSCCAILQMILRLT